MNYFITGIGTNVGKTVVSAILTEALNADYWKPIQSGATETTDSETVKSLISNTKTVVHPEAYLLKEPLSPHYAAKLEGVTINLDTIHLPETNNDLIIEGAGGIFVPINDTYYVIDVAHKFKCELILVISNYLGCINHSLLSLHYLEQKQFTIKAIVFNGNFEPEVELAIKSFNKNIPAIYIPKQNSISKKNTEAIAKTINLNKC